MRIRIVSRPPGEAPEEVREAWIGLELPVEDRRTGPRLFLVTSGVLSGPRVWWQELLSLVLGKFTRQSGYTVNALAAVNILATKDATAAAWWRSNCGYLLDGKHKFVFATEVCEEC